jgi:hypothetical protein
MKMEAADSSKMLVAICQKIVILMVIGFAEETNNLGA